MTDFSLVQQLETRLINAWPSLECQLAQGWILRFAKGYSKRANAATPLIPGVSLSDDLIDHVVRQFDAQKIRPCFRLTSLQADDVDGRLAGRGFEEIEPTFGMVAELADLPADEIAAEHAVRVDRRGRSALGPGRGERLWRRQVRRLDPDRDRLAHPPDQGLRDPRSRRRARRLGPWPSPSAAMSASTTSS